LTREPQPLRILVLTTTLPANVGDGTPGFVLTLSEELARRGNEVTVVAPQVPGARSVDQMGSVRVVRFRYFPRRWEDLASGAIVPNLKARPSRWIQVVPLVWALRSAARRQCRIRRAQVIHAHWIIPGAMVARTLGIPYVVTAHGADAYALSGPLMQRLKRMALRNSESVVPVSLDIRDRLLSLGCNPAAAMPMGVEVGSIRSAAGPWMPVAGRILFVGRLVDKKGVDDLIRALVALPDARVRLVGDGPNRSALESFAGSLGVQERVEFLGQLSAERVFLEMAHASVVALPSKVGEAGDADGVPVVIPEAMAVGVPIVVSDAGGLADYLRDGESAWVVPAGDADALASALAEALADPAEASRRASRAAARLDAFRIENIAEEYERILRAALA